MLAVASLHHSGKGVGFRLCTAYEWNMLFNSAYAVVRMRNAITCEVFLVHAVQLR
jgi:uncharacterized membrane protein